MLRAGRDPSGHPHRLRHSCAARSLSAGVPLALVAQQLGHRRPSTTLDHYSSLLPVDLERGIRADPLLLEEGEPDAKTDRPAGVDLNWQLLRR